MLINYTVPSTYDIMMPEIQIVQNGKPLFEVHKQTGEKIPVMRKQPPVSFGPGVKAISKEDWEKVEDNEFVQILRDEGKLVIEGKSDKLEDYAPAKAMRLIEQCNDTGLLRVWLRENRDAPTEFVEALKSKIDSIENPAKHARDEALKKRATKKHRGDMPEYLKKRAMISEMKKKPAAKEV
jgi:hypothetical protein